MDYIGSNWWKFWKWGEVSRKMADITNEANTIGTISTNFKSVSQNIEENAAKIQYYSGDTSDAKTNATEMASKLDNEFHVHFSILNPDNLTNGDIVQYHSQDTYYRYLRFVKEDENTVLMAGSNDKRINVTKQDFEKHVALKLTHTINNSTKNSTFTSSDVVNKAYEIQNSEINNVIQDAKDLKDTAEKLSLAGNIILGIGIFLSAVGFFTGNIYLFGVGSFLIVTGIGLSITGAILKSNADKDMNDANNGLADLNRYHGDHPNHAPVAGSMNLIGQGNCSLNGTLNASDVDKDTLEYVIVNQPAHGVIALTNSSFSYTPEANYRGYDSFTYEVDDGLEKSNIANMSIKVKNPPVVHDLALKTKTNQSVSYNFTSADSFGDSLDYVLVGQAQHGNINLTSNGQFNYVPDGNYAGWDSFTYKISNEVSNSSIATVNIRIGLNNTPPIAQNLNLTMLVNHAFNGLLNALDPDGDNLTYNISLEPQYGTISLNKNGSFTYIPDKDYYGKDTFTYTANNGFADSNVAKVTVNIKKPPFAQDLNISTSMDHKIDGSLNAFDPEGGKLSYILVSGPRHGTLKFDVKGKFIYTPSKSYKGIDTFTYKANNGYGDSNAAKVTIDVKKTNIIIWPKSENITSNPVLHDFNLKLPNVDINNLTSTINDSKYSNMNLTGNPLQILVQNGLNWFNELIGKLNSFKL